METLKLVFSLLVLLVGLTTGAAIAYDYNGQNAQAEAKVSWLISFPDGAPSAVVDDLMNKLEGLGATITHEYSTIRAWAFDAGQSVIDDFANRFQTTVNADWKPTIEADSIVRAFDGNGPV
ncbi:hypothetical protein Dda_8472 [Drechslerella dactyloides]|uniref:Uncharacterized protein n=1 Tax=Drechslerella dactyloides TaxID=74499 RepID=A0AAD6IQQ0_DREDA|nr:hypothetical protein Dda_8472 [Drechslerella dactyloides]